MFTMLNNTPLNRLMMLGAAAGAGKAVEATATGNPLTFQTDLARPLKSLLIPFTPQQEGTGDPSPENIRSILPWNGLTVWNVGKNLAKLTYGTKVPSVVTGQMVTGNGWSSDFIRIDKTKNYYCSGTASLGNVYVLYYGADHSYLGNRSHNSDGFSLNSDSYFSSATYVKLRNDSNSSAVLNIQLEEGSSATPYEEPHVTETDISFPSPVYGGTLDVVTGKLWANWKLWSVSEQTGWATSNNEIYHSTPNSSAIDGYAVQCVCESAVSMARERLYSHRNDSNIFAVAVNNNFLRVIARENGENIFATLDDWKAYIAENPLTIVYQLATPQEIQLTPEQITALVGDNTIWSDADGSMTAVYLKKG